MTPSTTRTRAALRGGCVLAIVHALLLYTSIQQANAQVLIPTSGGTPLTFSDYDDGSVQRSLGMTGSFYGSTYTQAYVNTNGTLNLSSFSEYANQTLGSSNAPAGIYVLWDDLVVDGSASIIENNLASTYYAVTWNNVRQYDNPSSRHTFQAAWFAGNSTHNSFSFRPGDIALSYAAVGATFSEGSAFSPHPGATIGIKASDSLYKPLPGDSDGVIDSGQASTLIPGANGFLLFRPDGTNYASARISATPTATTVSAGTLPIDGGEMNIGGGDLRVGNSNSATLNVRNGGDVTNSAGILGVDSGSTGTATVTAGSSWANTADFVVGQHGRGTLIVADGGQVTNDGAIIGSGADSSGNTATVTGPGSTWASNSILIVGNQGDGTLQVADGGHVTSTVGAIAQFAGAASSSLATVSDANSLWHTTGSLYVGGRALAAGGTGSLNVNDGGTVEVGGTLKLWGPGTLNINGGTVKATSFDRTVGTVNHNDGTLEVNSGTYTQTPGALYLNGNTAAALPKLVLDGGASTFGIGDLVIGETRQASLLVSGSSTLSTGWSVIAGSSGSTAAATVTGASSRWFNLSNLHIGGDGNGTLNVQDGGQVTNSHDLFIGTVGTGTLNVQEGGEVSNQYGYVGLASGSVGTATVTGAGSKWTSANLLYVGLDGNGTLNVEDGGEVSSYFATLGSGPNSIGRATVTGRNMGTSSKWTIDAIFEIGTSGDGILTIADGGEVSSGGTYMRNSEATVTGEGSKWTSSEFIFVGTGVGDGTLNVADGGEVVSSAGNIGREDGSTGEVMVTGAGSKWNINGSSYDKGLYVGGNSLQAGGTGSLSIKNAGLVNVTNTTKLWNGGTVTLDGGTLNTHDFDASVGTFNFNSGTLHVTGTTTVPGSLVVDGSSTYINDGSIAAPVVATGGGFVKGSGSFGSVTVGDGGIVSPGNSPGFMNDTLTTWNSGGSYLWEINSLVTDGGLAGNDPGWDLWDTGNLTVGATTLDKFTITIQSLDLDSDEGALLNWDSAVTQQWLIATANNGGGIFDSILNSLTIDASQFAGFNSLGSGHFELFANSGGSELWLAFNPVPEPSSFALAVTAVCGLLAARRRKAPSFTNL